VAESNADRVRQGFAAAVRGDLDAIAALLDPDVKWHGGDPEAEGACRNRAEALDVMRAGLVRLPAVELIDVIDAGDKVVVIMRPAASSGQRAAPVANLTTFRDGKVVEMVHYPNPDDAIAAARG
jgi:ketosteroid isomerase-like protein